MTDLRALIDAYVDAKIAATNSNVDNWERDKTRLDKAEANLTGYLATLSRRAEMTAYNDEDENLMADRRPALDQKALEATLQFNRIVDRVEARCTAVDGPVTPTLQEITEQELSDLWRAVQAIRTALSPSPAVVPSGGERLDVVRAAIKTLPLDEAQPSFAMDALVAKLPDLKKKEVYNAVTYLARRGELQRIAYGKYLIVNLGSGHPAVVPSGWKLVPIEPTPEMIHAGGNAIRDEGVQIWPFRAGRVAYRAYLTTAPSPPALDGAARLRITPNPTGEQA